MHQRAKASAETTRSHQPEVTPARTLQRKPAPANSPIPWTGNQARLRRLASPVLQRKLTIGATSDPLEAEADRIADRVMRMPDAAFPPPAVSNAASAAPLTTRLQRKCSCGGKCDHCKANASRRNNPEDEYEIHRKPAGPAPVSEAPPSVHQTLRAPGSPLDAGTRAFMEPRLGADLSSVRIHTDTRAAESARQLESLAYTVGNSIVFRSGRYQPRTPAGRRLLAHELTHVLQQGAAATHAIQRKSGGKDSPKTADCPEIEPGELKDSAKAKLQMVETIPQQEWLIYGFPIGSSEISSAEAGQFISDIVKRLMQGHFIYVTGQDPLDVIGFSDCFSGPKVDNQFIRSGRAAKFCAGVKDKYAATPKTYPSLIHSCGPAPADQYINSNATRADRARNRSVLIRRLSPQVQYQQGFPYDPDYSPSAAHCAAYITPPASEILGPVYTRNAHCSCLVTPDEPHNNCVRSCLQDKMWTLLAKVYPGRSPTDPPLDIELVCPIIWQHHRDCYHDCGCASPFIAYPAFDAVCNIPLPCSVDSAAINLVNRCMPGTDRTKYLPTGDIDKAL